jgi:RimJ/RimL family protein N-acetyltransferase
MPRPPFLRAFLLLAPGAACVSAETPGLAPPVAPVDPWSAEFQPPETLDTPRVHLEPLRPELAQLDFDAVTSSRDHLRRTLRWGSWPGDDMTLEQNRGDIEQHWNEFVAREGYAYSVLASDRARCLGCLYMRPGRDAELDLPAVEVAFWVVEDELESELDAHLLAALLEWITNEWPFDSLLWPVHQDNERANAIARGLGLEHRGTRQAHVRWAWWRW